ncbi:MAG TPA: HAD-IA family hydrolase [Acidimicrobiales bacterium]|nr:HAD-IA family hydrolase [Acidimicrobiales bacterium]
MDWLVCDYGDVISLGQTRSDVEQLAELCGLGVDAFADAYWSRRLAYDRGDLDAASFWTSVAASPLDGGTLARCIASDIASWTRLDPRSTAAVERCERRGLRLGLLSNAPVEIARTLDATTWFSRFEHRLFSCDLRLTKPEPAIYDALLERLGADAAAVTFVDDRHANVEAAAAAGICAVLYTGPEVLENL